LAGRSAIDSVYGTDMSRPFSTAEAAENFLIGGVLGLIGGAKGQNTPLAKDVFYAAVRNESKFMDLLERSPLSEDERKQIINKYNQYKEIDELNSDLEDGERNFENYKAFSILKLNELKAKTAKIYGEEDSRVVEIQSKIDAIKNEKYDKNKSGLVELFSNDIAAIKTEEDKEESDKAREEVSKEITDRDKDIIELREKRKELGVDDLKTELGDILTMSDTDNSTMTRVENSSKAEVPLKRSSMTTLSSFSMNILPETAMA
jgi:hypothetical protein